MDGKNSLTKGPLTKGEQEKKQQNNNNNNSNSNKNNNNNNNNSSELECGPMPNVMAAQPNIGGALCTRQNS